MGECIAKDVSVSMGFDVDRSNIVVCAGSRERRVWEGKIRYDLGAVDRLLGRFPGCEVTVCYEAGPFGFALARHLGVWGVRCKVLSPSLMPKPPGGRVKTDRRDAHQLMELGWSEEVSVARVPTEEEEAERQVVRVREELGRKRRRVMEQIKSFGYEYDRRDLLGNWGRSHMGRLREARFEQGYLRRALDEYLREYDELTDRVGGMKGVLEELAGSERHREAVGRMRSSRGIGLVTAMTVRTELFRPEEFGGSEEVGSYLGFTPSERSSGGHRRLGHIHRMGNGHLRGVLVQSAWSLVRWEEGARGHFGRLAERMGKKKAIVAVARRVGIGLWASMVKGEDFEYRWR